jgi:hypothetical protein
MVNRAMQVGFVLANDISVKVIQFDDFYIWCQLSYPQLDFSWTFINIHASCDDRPR